MHLIHRPFAWAAIDDSGTVYHEADYGSLSGIPEGTIVALAAVSLEQQHLVRLPLGAEPVCFWRVELTANAVEETRTETLVIGWRLDGRQILLWVDGDGSVRLTQDQ